MYSILTISESFDNDLFDISLDIATIKAFGYDALPLAVNNCTRLEVASAMNEVFANGTSHPDAINIGILTENNVVLGVAERLKRYKAHTIVIDPALISEDGSVLVTEEVFNNLSSKLYPLATILTPNPYELELLSGLEVHSEDDLIKAARELSIKYRCAVFVKAFNSFGVDLLVNGNEFAWIPRNGSIPRARYSFSVALACMLPECESLEQAVTSASQFTYGVAQEEKDVKSSIPFTLNPTASDMELRTKSTDVEEYESKDISEVIETTTLQAKSSNSLSNLQSLRTLASMNSAEVNVAPNGSSKKEVEVIVDVDNFAPDPVIDETLSRSLQELRDKINKLR